MHKAVIDSESAATAGHDRGARAAASHQIGQRVSWLHRLAAFLAMMALFSIAMGTLVHATGAALWLQHAPNPAPSSGRVFAWLQGSSGIKFEPAYRGGVALATLLAAALGLCLWRSKSARYVKILGGLATGATIIQVGLCRVVSIPNPPLGLSIAYTLSSLLFFSLAVCLALFTRTDWRWDSAKTADVTAPSLRTLLVFTTAALLVVAGLGAGGRPGTLGTKPHLWGSFVVTALVFWVLEIALNKFPHVAPIKIPAILLAELVAVQLFLGLVAYSMELNARVDPRSLPGLGVINTTHAAIGALGLGASLFATFQAFRYLTPESALAALNAASDAKPYEAVENS